MRAGEHRLPLGVREVHTEQIVVFDVFGLSESRECLTIIRREEHTWPVDAVLPKGGRVFRLENDPQRSIRDRVGTAPLAQREPGTSSVVRGEQPDAVTDADDDSLGARL